MRSRRKQRLRGSTLTGTQRQMLLYGQVFSPKGVGFESLEQERAAWLANREELMQVIDVGTRPAGFFKFDLAVEYPRWRIQQIGALVEKRQISNEEAARLEAMYPELAGDTGSGQEFGDVEGLARMDLGEYSLCRAAAKFQVAAIWNRWRGREEVAERFSARASVVRNFITRKGEQQ